ncbi:hypothetical protein E4656_00790 [Natronospirillum operosum]|uniref:Uncharacterized protein n=1 Tax=Natronospirillum operosum TaxID=2759953 RepID=A0A4Z0WEC7_9GAMM|nr:hypothetical protein [Natronospirillum operosum]TGG94998.1 hypothetical protein E4656_00790 [Natronospirillum operosum]
MRPIIIGKNLLTDDEILAYAMSEDNYRMLTLERLQHHALTAALLTASTLIRLHRQAQAPQLPPVSGREARE